MYGKMIDSKLIIAPRSLTGNGILVFNPPTKMYLAQGWKPVALTPLPEAPAGWHYEVGWEETAEEILQTWTLVEDPDEIDSEEALEILLGGGSHEA